MNRRATAARPRVPTVVATLDLADEAQSRVHALVHRLHAGRWPLFVCLGMRQHNGVLYEAVQWARMAVATYAVIQYRADGLGLSWSDARSKSAALSALRDL